VASYSVILRRSGTTAPAYATTTTTASGKTFTGTSGHTYTVTVTVRDKAGNTSRLATRSVRL
jgi:hypothetical protein